MVKEQNFDSIELMETIQAIILSLVLLPIASAHAQTTTVLDHHESVAPKVMIWPIDVPPFSIEHQVRLVLEARIDWPKLAGSNSWIIITVNGNRLSNENLLNKTDEFVMRRGTDLTWYNRGQWRILYSPDFLAAIEDKQNSYSLDPKDEPYRFVFDITHLVQPGMNELRIQHLKILQKPSTLVLRNVKIEVGRAIQPPGEDVVQPAPTGPLPLIVVRKPPKLDIQATASDATIDLRIGHQAITLRTRISLPGGRWREAKPDGDTSFSAGPCRVSRKITVRNDHVHVADTLTNTSDELIGAIIEHHADLIDKPQALYLAGRKSFADTADARQSAHPSAFAQFPKFGVGLVAEDDVFRVHVRSFHNPKTFGLSDDRLGLAPGSKTTLEWSIYPLLGTRFDYWAFVNAVRRNWDVNYTIPGPFSFANLPRGLTGPQYAKWMHDRGLIYVCGGIAKYTNGQYAHGTGIFFAPKFVARQRDWTTRMPAADPNLVPLAYFHAQLSTEPYSRIKYADARLLDHRGQQIDYPYKYPLPLFVPTVDNSYGQAIWRFLDKLINDVGARGIYWYEMSYSVQRFATGLPWDGHTVGINSRTHRVTGKLTAVSLIMEPLQLKIIDYIRGKGLFLMANSQPQTRTMMRKKLVRFVETSTYSALANAHLACPLALGNHHPEKTQADRARNVREILKRGGVYYGHLYDHAPAPWNFNTVMYPITPQEIGPGYVLGQERIHTAISGRFAFSDGTAAQVYVVNADGQRVEKGMYQEVCDDGRYSYELRMPSDHFAILVKQ